MKNKAISHSKHGFSEDVGRESQVRMKNKGTVRVISTHGSMVIFTNSFNFSIIIEST